MSGQTRDSQNKISQQTGMRTTEESNHSEDKSTIVRRMSHGLYVAVSWEIFGRVCQSIRMIWIYRRANVLSFSIVWCARGTETDTLYPGDADKRESISDAHCR